MLFKSLFRLHTYNSDAVLIASLLAAASPNCAQAQLIWQHGNFSQNANGSLTLTPFEGDGRQMIQNGCTQVSSTVSYYGQRELFTGFYIRTDWHFGQGNYYLQLYEFDGTPKPWMWQTYNPPQMLPTTPLKQVVSRMLVSLHLMQYIYPTPSSPLHRSMDHSMALLQRLWRRDDRCYHYGPLSTCIIDLLDPSWTFPACSLVAFLSFRSCFS